MPDDPQLADLRRRYLSDQVATASPEQRLLMLFDRLLSDLRAAEAAFAEADLHGINESLVHAQRILLALRDPLDRDTDLGRALVAVYSFCFERLIEANLRKDPSWLPTCRGLLEQIAAANRAALQVPAGNEGVARAG